MFVFLVTQRDGFPCLGLTQNSTEVQWTITQKTRARPSYNMILRLSLSIRIIRTLYTAQSKHIVQPHTKQQVRSQKYISSFGLVIWDESALNKHLFN